MDTAHKKRTKRKDIPNGMVFACGWHRIVLVPPRIDSWRPDVFETRREDNKSLVLAPQKKKVIFVFDDFCVLRKVDALTPYSLHGDILVSDSATVSFGDEAPMPWDDAKHEVMGADALVTLNHECKVERVHVVDDQVLSDHQIKPNTHECRPVHGCNNPKVKDCFSCGLSR